MKICLILVVLSLASCAGAQRCGFDESFYNGNILTGKELLGAKPERVSAIGIIGGRIVAVNQRDLVPGCGEDLHGAFVMPGFNDAHTHVASAGEQKLSVDLDGAGSLAEMQARIKVYAASLGTGQWVLGGGWDHTKWASGVLPTRRDLDAVTAGHPALLYRTDGHIAVANTAALEAAGIKPSTVAPAGAKIDLDGQGQLTGIVREAPALALLEAKVPKPDAARRRRALEVAFADAAAHGVTSVQDYSEWDDFLVMEAMERERKLPVRVSEWLTFNDPIDVLKKERAHHAAAGLGTGFGADDPMLHTGMLKGFMDGSLGSRTAAMLAPYSDDAKNSGLPRYEQAKLNAMAIERAQAGFQLGFHAIGDRANTMALDAIEAADADVRERSRCRPTVEPASRGTMCPAPARPVSRFRFRIEHAQVVAPADFDRFAKLGVVASMQPSHLLTDMAWAGARLGPAREKGSYAWRTMLDHHVVLAFGTDYPVESVSPFRGLYAAVTRQNEAGTATYEPQEKLSIYEAIYAYTQGSAFAEFAEKQKGLIAKDFLADFVVLDRDITKATAEEILHAKVLRTVMGGKTVYTAPATAVAERAHPGWQLPDGD